MESADVELSLTKLDSFHCLNHNMKHTHSEVRASVFANERFLRLLHRVVNEGLPRMDKDNMDWFRTIARLSKSSLNNIDRFIKEECLECSYPFHDPACMSCGQPIAGVLMIQAGHLLHHGCCKLGLDKRYHKASIAHVTRYGRYYKKSFNFDLHE